MSRVDIAKLRRLHEAAKKGKWVAMTAEHDAEDGIAWAQSADCQRDADHAEYISACHNALPALLDELEAAQEEVRRLTQAVGDLRKERDRAVKEAQRQDSVAKVLRAELAAAKAKMQEGEDDCRFCRDLEGGSKYPCTCGWTYGALALAYGNAIQERDRLAADNARLREALEEIAALAEEDISELTGVAGQMVCVFCGDVPHEEKCPHVIATTALATPAQSLAAHDAAVKGAVLAAMEGENDGK